MEKQKRCPNCGGTNFIRTGTEKTIEGKKKKVWCTSCDECGMEIKYEDIV